MNCIKCMRINIFLTITAEFYLSSPISSWISRIFKDSTSPIHDDSRIPSVLLRKTIPMTCLSENPTLYEIHSKR